MPGNSYFSHVTAKITVAQHCQFSSSSSSTISWRMERSAMPSSHDFVMKFLLNPWLGLLTPFCRSGFLKNLHRVGNVPVLVVSGRACKKRIYFLNKSMAKFIKVCVGKGEKSKGFKGLIFSPFSTHNFINFVFLLNKCIAKFLQSFLKKDVFSPIS